MHQPHKTTLPLLLGAALMLGGCASDSVTQITPVYMPADATAPYNPTVGNDGSSFEKAVVITASGEMDGVKAEYAWIREHVPGGKPAGQSLQRHGKKVYDVQQVKLPDGSTRTVYFDITGFFGKL